MSEDRRTVTRLVRHATDTTPPRSRAVAVAVEAVVGRLVTRPLGGLHLCKNRHQRPHRVQLVRITRTAAVPEPLDLHESSPIALICRLARVHQPSSGHGERCALSTSN